METIVYECDPHDPPGSIAPALKSAGGTWTLRRLWKGEALAPWHRVRAAVLLGGGPMVWDPPQTTPWMAPLIAWTREATTRGQVAIIGICLGHQVLAAALGGRVEEMERARRGIGTPQWTPAGRAEAALSGFVEHGPVMYSHRAAVVQAPPGATTLARSPESKAAAFRIGRSIGVQWHPEVDRARISCWAQRNGRRMWADRLGLGETGVTMVEALDRHEAWAKATATLVSAVLAGTPGRRTSTR